MRSLASKLQAPHMEVGSQAVSAARLYHQTIAASTSAVSAAPEAAVAVNRHFFQATLAAPAAVAVAEVGP